MKICQQCGTESEDYQNNCSICGADLRAYAEQIKPPTVFSASTIYDNNDIKNTFDKAAKVAAAEIKQNFSEENRTFLAEHFEYESLSKGYRITKLKKKSEIDIDIPEGVTVIGTRAFEDSKLMRIKLPESLQLIESKAFANCKDLKGITLPNSLEEIYDDSFEGCPNAPQIPEHVHVKRFSASEMLKELKKSEQARHNAAADAKDIVKKAREGNDIPESSIENGKEASWAFYEAETTVDKIITAAHNEAKEILRQSHSEAEAATDKIIKAAKKEADLILQDANIQRKNATQALNEARATADKAIKAAKKEADDIISKHQGMRDEYNAFITAAHNEAEKILQHTKDEAKEILQQAKNEAKEILRQAKDESLYQTKALAQKGDHDAQLALANMYFNGSDVTEDKSEAFVWFKKAAKQGNRAAMEAVGDCYKNGIGVMKSASQAFKWYKKAADMGSKTAMEAVGDCYKNGEGTSKNLKQAIKYYEQAQ